MSKSTETAVGNATDEQIAKALSDLKVLEDDFRVGGTTYAADWLKNAAAQLRRARFHELQNYQRAQDEEEERIHWEAEHAALFGAVWKLAQTKPGATGRALRAICEGSAMPVDDEKFCDTCFAGMTSDEHRAKCGEGD